MISYYDGQLTDIMPGNITRNPEVKALSYALQQACRLLYRYSQRIYIYSNMDEQPEEVIDLLAAELRTQYYSSMMDIGTKRQLVKNTLVWYTGAGTPAAVEELVSAVFGDGKVEEWFEYGDEPFYFRIIVNTAPMPDMISYLDNMIGKVKNTRSHLRSVDIQRETHQESFAGVGMSQYFHPAAIIDGFRLEKVETGKQYIGGKAVNSLENHTIMEEGLRWHNHLIMP